MKAPTQTHSETITGADRAQAAVARLAADSQWFAFMPLPDDAYEITVRPENAEWLRRLAAAEPLGTYSGSLDTINSRRDRFGNCYFAFRYIDFASGRSVCATTSGGASNVRIAAQHLDGRTLQHETELPIREFNRLVKSWMHAGCDPAEIAAYIRERLAAAEPAQC